MHRRNVGPMRAAARCGAKTRSDGFCRAPAIRGKKRCRMHGGTSPGAPKGNLNAFKHGKNAAEVLEAKRYVRELTKRARALDG